MGKLIAELKNVKVEYALRTVLDIDCFALYEGEKIGLVGENGAGKSTLIKVISGEKAPDTGEVRLLAPVSVIHQMDEAGQSPVTDARMAALFHAKDDADTLSGGEKTRRRIAAALGGDGELLLADEPTSDLDRAGVEALEKALIAHQGTVLLISHDRALLRAVCTDIVELEDARLTRYPGGWDAYREEKARRRAHNQDEYDQYRREQRRLRAAVEGKRESASQVLKTPKRMGNSEARLHKRSSTETEQKLNQQKSAIESRLSQLEVKERPRDMPAIRMRLGAEGAIVSKTALEFSDLTLRVPGLTLLEGASMRVPTSSRTALIGPNGSGKTTLLERIRARDPRIRLAPGIEIGYFGQDHQKILDLTKSALHNAMCDASAPQDVVRTVLARLGMRGDQVFKSASVLSGGERAKIALAKILVGRANFLVLDEPTNHLDLYSMEALEAVLSEYAGTLLLVSHDRELIEKCATRLTFFEEGKLITFEGGMAALRASKQRAGQVQQPSVDKMTIEMRLAELAGRIARPKKGDDVVELREQYEQLAEEKRRRFP